MKERITLSPGRMWLTGGAALTGLLVILNLLLPRAAYPVIALHNTAGLLLLAVMIVQLLRNMRGAQGDAKVFWWLMVTGTGLLFSVQACWWYYEVLVRQPFPRMNWSDPVLFLHMIPLMAALAYRPHIKTDRREQKQRLLDVTLLSLWWIYLFIFFLGPWQFASPDLIQYGKSFVSLYEFEHAGLLVALIAVCYSAQGAWRRFFIRLTVVRVAYSLQSMAMNAAIGLPKESPWVYFSGSFYDIAWIASLFALLWALYLPAEALQELNSHRETQRPIGVTSGVAGKLANAAALSMPLLAMYVLLFATEQKEVTQFRLLITCIALVPLTASVFFKQKSLNQALQASLLQSHEAYNDLRQLQGNLLHAEKLASIGRLVAGAAHEINNPLTAIVGYSELLASESPPGSIQKEYGEKMLQQAKRTSSMVTNLLAFAKQSPAHHRRVELNYITERALEMHAGDGSSNIRIEKEFAAELPAINGDESHLLQVLTHILNSSIESLRESGGAGTICLKTAVENGRAVWMCSTPSIDTDPEHVFDPFFSSKRSGKAPSLGLSASYGIIRDHGGSLSCRNLPEGGSMFIIALPIPEVLASQSG